MIYITVLSGGDSAERAVSLRSGAAVEQALLAVGYDVIMLDPAQPHGDYKARLQAADLVFPVLHGQGGEDGSLQAWLEEHHIRYVGADSTSSKLCFDKWQYKQAL